MVILRKKGDKPKTPEPRKYLYQVKKRFFAQISEGLKDAAIGELEYLGAADISPGYRGVWFSAEKDVLYRINYCSRLISRVLAPLVTFRCFDTDNLYSQIKLIEWRQFLDEENTFAVFANVSESRINHSKFAALRIKDAIVDHFLEHVGLRPSVSPHNPDLEINLHIRKNVVDLSIDVSGGALHRRGYREETVSGPMQETLAAGIIRMTGWDGQVPLYDPMCGSGTLLSEALMHYCRIPAGIFRKRFGFEQLPDFDPELWQRVKAEADNRIRTVPEGWIAGSDRDEAAVHAARTNLLGIHHGNRVDIIHSDFRELSGFANQMIVTNPPYGIRMGRDQDLESLFRDFGNFLKHKCKGATAFVYFGDPHYSKHIGLKPSWKKPLKAGGLEGRLVKYEMF